VTHHEILSFFAGIGLFWADLAVLVYVGRRLLSGPPAGTGKRDRPAQALLVAGLLVKVVIAGAGVYVALVSLHLAGGFFALGLAVGLLAFAGPQVLTHARFFPLPRRRNLS
jgi:hypothetical protein